MHGAATSLIAGYGYSGILIAFAARHLAGRRGAGGDPRRRYRRQRQPAAAAARAARRLGDVLLGFAFVALIGSETLRGCKAFGGR